MVNPPLSEKLLDADYVETGLWIIVYDFLDFKPNPNFWANLKRISFTEGGKLIQYSVYQSEKMREAKAVKNLVNHYGGEAQVFRCSTSNL